MKISKGVKVMTDVRMRRDIMDVIENTCDRMTARFSRVLCIRMDVRFPADYPHDGMNSEIGDLTKRLREGLGFHGIEVQYVWVREQKTSENPRYHLIVFVDGHEVRSPYRIFSAAERLWGNIIGVCAVGLIDHCNHEYNGVAAQNGIMLRRPNNMASDQEFDEQSQAFDSARAYVLYRASYLAKTHTKGNAPYRVREYGYSQLR